MKAMIFAAGVGSRLGEITQSIPKCLVQAGGKTMLQHVIEKLKKANVSSIMINLHHYGEQVEKFIKDNGSFDMQIGFSREKELLGTGGGLKNVADFFAAERDFFIYNADIYCDLDLNDLLTFHRSKQALATLVTMKRVTSRYLLFDKSEQLVGWESKDAEGNFDKQKITEINKLAFGGIHVCTPALFKAMEGEAGNFSIIKSYLKAASEGGFVRPFLLDKQYWMDIGKPESLSALVKYLR